MIEIFSKFGFTNIFSGWMTPLPILSLITIFVIVLGSLFIQWRNKGKFAITKNIIKHTPLKFIAYCVLYLLSGILQQSVLVLLYNMFEWLRPDFHWNKIFASGVFALFHFPNFLLMFAVMGMGIVFLSHFEIYRNIYIIGLLHGLIANVMKFTLPEELSTSFTVWFKYIAFYKVEHRRNKAVSKLKKSLIDKCAVCMNHPIEISARERVSSDMSCFIDTQKFNGVPDMVINLIKEDNAKDVRYDRPKLYYRAGISEHWIADPYNKSIEVFALTNSGYELYCFAVGGQLIKSRVISDFNKTADEMFVRFELFNINPAM